MGERKPQVCCNMCSMIDLQCHYLKTRAPIKASMHSQQFPMPFRFSMPLALLAES